jgi:peptide/nickel transport system substrate-binding protein
MRRRSLMLAAAATAGVAASPITAPPARSQAAPPIRVVMNTELQVLDPIVTNANVTRAFGYMVFDTLIAMDEAGEYRPQMLESWRASEDRLTWTFTLRPGLEWHDGRPVTAEDCVASLKRWGRRDGMGTRLMAATRALRVVDQRTFVLELSRPFGFVIEAIGKPAAQVPFMMPARLAATEPTRAVPEIVGSGPFTFRREEWRPGDRAVFRRNRNYRPREEPANGLGGGKVVRVEQVDFVSLPDHATKVSALLAGEIDFLEYAPLDFVAMLRRDRNIVVTAPRPLAQSMGGVQINHTQPPFDNLLVRRALQQAVDQREIMAGLGLPPDITMEFCQSIFMCGGPYESDAGTAPLRGASIERARELLREAGYAGQRTVLLHSTDSALINPMALVLIDRMRRAGFNLDVVATDFSSVAQRRLNHEPVERGGWSVVPVVWTGYDLANPLAHYGTAYNCGTAYPGRYCDPELTPILERFAAESDPARRRELAAEMQARVHGQALMGFMGQFFVPSAYRRSLRGVQEIGFPVLWNVERVGR